MWWHQATLADEINRLLDAQEKVLARARSRATDLAHGLKTPLQVLSADIRALRKKGETDLADEIEWAKSRSLQPATYAEQAADRSPPIPVELFVRLWAGYEREKDRAGRLDFDDMLTRTVDLLESDASAAATVRARYGWFTVDEYQDTNPLQQRLL